MNYANIAKASKCFLSPQISYTNVVIIITKLNKLLVLLQFCVWFVQMALQYIAVSNQAGNNEKVCILLSPHAFPSYKCIESTCIDYKQIIPNCHFHCTELSTVTSTSVCSCLKASQWEKLAMQCNLFFLAEFPFREARCSPHRVFRKRCRGHGWRK